MSEKFQSNIERYDKKLIAQIGRTAIVFSYLNTRIYEHPEQYRQFDHAYRTDDEGDKYYLRSTYPEIYDALNEHNFPKSTMPYPSLHDEEVIMKHYDETLHQELGKLLEGSDE